MRPTIESIRKECAAQLDRFFHARVAEPATSEDILQEVVIKLQNRSE